VLLCFDETSLNDMLTAGGAFATARAYEGL
jgi:hypothetical protein